MNSMSPGDVEAALQLVSDTKAQKSGRYIDLTARINSLRHKHTELSNKIAHIEANEPGHCSCELRRMKKEKLQLKDEITKLQKEQG